MSQMIESFLHPSTPSTPLRAQPIELGAADLSGGQGPALLRDPHPLHAVRVSLSVSVGSVQLSVGELLQAREQSVLVLDRLVEHPVDLLLHGKVVARGQLVAVDGAFGVLLTELPAPLRI